MSILCPGAIFEALPRAQNIKLGQKNEHSPRLKPKHTRNTKNVSRNLLGQELNNFEDQPKSAKISKTNQVPDPQP